MDPPWLRLVRVSKLTRIVNKPDINIRVRALSVIGLWLLMAVAWSCGPQMGESGSPAAVPVLKTYESGTVTATIEINAGNITVADQLEVAVEVIAGEQQRVVFPDIEDKLGGFRVIGARLADPKLLDDGRVARRRTYVLEPFLPGEYEIPELTIVPIASDIP